jgi:hypothetical protein
MLVSTPETVAEAKNALKEFMQRSRDATQSRPDSFGATFCTDGGADTNLITDDNRERIIEEARTSARRYYEARGKNLRLLRWIEETNQAAVEGQLSALNWLKRKGESRLKR